jgi:hypothetical protein
MPLTARRNLKDTLLALEGATEEDLFQENHIFEPEFHQAKYRNPVDRISKKQNSFLVSQANLLVRPIARGLQPKYADSEDDPQSLEYEGMVLSDGDLLDSAGDTRNVCALKSNCVRWGYIDLALARSVKRDWANGKGVRGIVQRNDVLVNSTGDGTIGRVAVYDFDAPAIVDGHISIVRYKQPALAWYVAAFLLSEDGQNQLYRYVNGSSGQVELYPQDIGRVWVPDPGSERQEKIGEAFKKACEKHYDFFKDMRKALSLIDTDAT